MADDGDNDDDDDDDNNDDDDGVPQGSILVPLIFLMYVNDMARAVDCDLLLYADDSCLIFRDKVIEKIDST